MTSGPASNVPSSPPGIDPPRPWTFPDPVITQLDNGLTVEAYHLPGQYLISARVVLDVPLSAEDPDRLGVATIMARCLDEGTEQHPGERYADALEGAGAGFGIDVSLSGIQAVLDVPATRLEQAFALFAEAVQAPSLAESDVQRHVTLRLAQIEQARANSAQTAANEFRRVVYAADSRAAAMTGGEPETLSQVTTEAVRDFHATRVGPQRSTVIVAGDFGGGALDPVALVERHLGTWSNPGQRLADHQRVGAGARRRVLVDRPGAVQADLRLGGYGPDRSDPRWADLSVASYAMGGAFLSRLNAWLREEKGYTYGVRLGFGPLRQGGSYAVQGSFRTEVLAAAVEDALGILEVADKPFTTAEVTDAISYTTGVSPLRYATADEVTDQAGVQHVADLGIGYVTRSLAALRRVTPESATAAYRDAVDVDQLSLVVVGDAEQLAEPLRALGFDDLEVVARA